MLTAQLYGVCRCIRFPPSKNIYSYFCQCTTILSFNSRSENLKCETLSRIPNIERWRWPKVFLTMLSWHGCRKLWTRSSCVLWCCWPIDSEILLCCYVFSRFCSVFIHFAWSCECLQCYIRPVSMATDLWYTPLLIAVELDLKRELISCILKKISRSICVAWKPQMVKKIIWK